MLILGFEDPTNHRAALRASQPMRPPFSNISNLKQFTPKKMGAEVLILPNSWFPISFRASGLSALLDNFLGFGVKQQRRLLKVHLSHSPIFCVPCCWSPLWGILVSSGSILLRFEEKLGGCNLIQADILHFAIYREYRMPYSAMPECKRKRLLSKFRIYGK